MPIREAVARLSGDRFVTVVPRRGTYVTPLGLADVLAMFEAREAIECGVAHLAARRATPAQLERLRALADDADRVRSADAIEQHLHADHAIHLHLVGMTGNAILQEAVDRLLQHNLRFWRSYWTTHEPTRLGHALPRRPASPRSRRATPRPPRRRCASTSGPPAGCSRTRSGRSPLSLGRPIGQDARFGELFSAIERSESERTPCASATSAGDLVEEPATVARKASRSSTCGEWPDPSKTTSRASGTRSAIVSDMDTGVTQS